MKIVNFEFHTSRSTERKDASKSVNQKKAISLKVFGFDNLIFVSVIVLKIVNFLTINQF